MQKLPDSKRKDKPILVYLSPVEKRKVKRMATKAGISMGELFRRGVFGQP